MRNDKTIEKEIEMSKVKVNLNFSPMLSGSIEAVVTTHGGKSEQHYMSDTESMLMSSKSSIKSIKVVSNYAANSESGIMAYNGYKNS